ncbi:MAG: 30S ribosomal protein S16 [Magnetococcales bacterium]|nr:30S ribosomal protein S16 [Magnetococcales bacterium]MBF0270580.1 30S ribosomal protein S16 [Magnetococcales bacterium]
MAVRIRMQRRGSKKRPFYAVVAADSRMPRDGRFLEKLGVFNPLKETDRVSLNMERINHWIGVGALPSDTVGRLIKQVQEATA